jgi:hypothetical protein
MDCHGVDLQKQTMRQSYGRGVDAALNFIAVARTLGPAGSANIYPAGIQAKSEEISRQTSYC